MLFEAMVKFSLKSQSTDIQPEGSVSMSMTHLITKGHVDIPPLGCRWEYADI